MENTTDDLHNFQPYCQLNIEYLYETDFFLSFARVELNIKQILVNKSSQ